MKKILLVVCTVIMGILCGCNKNENDIELVSIKEVRENVNKELEETKNGKYDNLILDDNVSVQITNENEIYKLNLKFENYYKNLGEYLSNIPEIMKVMFEKDDININKIATPGYFTESGAVREELREWDCTYNEMIKNYNNGTYTGKDGKQPSVEYRDGNIYGFTNSDLCLMWIFRGKTKDIFLKDFNNEFVPQWFSYANYEIKNYDVYEDDINDSYNLLDGQISIKDSISYVESYINNEFKYSGNKDLKTKVYSVDLVKLDENYYGYHMYMQREYGGILFEPIQNGTYTQGDESRTFDMIDCFVIEKGNIDYYYGSVNNEKIEKINPTITKIIPLNKVMELVSKKVASGTKFHVNKIQLAYIRNYIGEAKVDERRDEKVTPVWLISTKNEKDNSIINFYVDLLTGKIDNIIFN